jgi:lipopolysaccharide/colanic/teichoic acid biosynthesis glycosyltransferase
MVLAALAVRVEDGKPVLFRQTRVGLGGREFTLYKFRSMRIDAEQDSVPLWAAENDPRITRVGAILRRFRIDELPQFYNVLRGDMSFVGPRPERPYFVDQLADAIPHYTSRHNVKPGITGWAQVSFRYGASFEDACEKTAYDLYYVKHQSTLLDLVILARTVKVIFWPHGVR